jgi:hypothetical protein
LHVSTSHHCGRRFSRNIALLSTSNEGATKRFPFLPYLAWLNITLLSIRWSASSYSNADTCYYDDDDDNNEDEQNKDNNENNQNYYENNNDKNNNENNNIQYYNEGNEDEDDNNNNSQENDGGNYYNGKNQENNDGNNNDNQNDNDGGDNNNNQNNNDGEDNNNNQNNNDGGDNNNNQNNNDGGDNNNNQNNNDGGDNNNNENNNQNNGNDNNANGRLRFLQEGNDQMQWQCGMGSHQCEEQGSEDKWWVGMQPCMGANVAYSLYGVLDNGKAESGNPCSKANYVNSFFTTDGLTTFAYASKGKIDTSALTQVCTQNGDYAYSTGCSASGTFTMDKFSNGVCTSENYYSTTDTLNSLNEVLQDDMSCVLIYSSDGSVDYASGLLSQSVECSINMGHGESCPDPYGLLSKYEYNFSKVQRYSDASFLVKHGQKLYKAITAVLIASSIALLIRRFMISYTSNCYTNIPKKHSTLSIGLD